MGLTASALSGRQVAIYDFIVDYLRREQLPPSIRDIQDGTNISSTSVVVYNLVRLDRIGLIEYQAQPGRFRSRGIKIVVKPGDACPFCGRHG